MEKEQIVDFMSGMIFYNPNSAVVLRGSIPEATIVPGKGARKTSNIKVVIIAVGLIFMLVCLTIPWLYPYF